MLPLALLKTAQGHPVVRGRQPTGGVCMHLSIPKTQLIELKNGETYNGHMLACDTWMNVHLREVICTAKVRTYMHM